MLQNFRERKKVRCPNWNYSKAGAYFITFVVKNRENIFGEVRDGDMCLNQYGKIAHRVWSEIPIHYPECRLDDFVIMPNHVHGIFILDKVHEKLEKRNLQRIPNIIGSAKSEITRQIHLQQLPNFSWQRSFHDRIIRNETEFYYISRYIQANPTRWYKDRLNVERR